MKLNISIVVAASLVTWLGLASPAAANLVTDGNFLNTTYASPGGHVCNDAGSTDSYCQDTLANWTVDCSFQGCASGENPASLLFPGSNGSAFNGNIGLGVYHDSPIAGANVFADDGDVAYSAAISQDISGLIAGQKYTLSFWQASGQQAGETGATTEYWAASLGAETHYSNVMNTPEQGAVAWNKASLGFTVTSGTETLYFQSYGTPRGFPPVALLTGVELSNAPEPSTWAIVISGIVGLGGLTRRRRALA